MAATGSSSARSSLFIQLSPSRSAKLSFTIQLLLTLLWVTWAGMLAFSDTPSSGGGESYLFYAFFGLSIAFLVYVVLQNTSVFGFQSYIEVTPEYIVRKHGVFRPKHVVAIPNIKAVHISPLALRVTESNDTQTYFDLKQVRKRRDQAKIKNKVKDLATQHGFEVTETSSNR